MHLSDVEHKSVYTTGHTKMSVFFCQCLSNDCACNNETVPERRTIGNLTDAFFVQKFIFLQYRTHNVQDNLVRMPFSLTRSVCS